VRQETDNTPAESGILHRPTPTVARLTVETRIIEASAEAGGGSEFDARVSAGAGERLLRLAVFGAILAIAGSYAAFHIGRGWAASDDGTLSQSALRVFQGQLPHRDFTEIYTGGLSFIHAMAFRAFGVNLMSLRICVFLFFLAWIPAVYYIALRFVSAIPAGAITLLAVAWSYPNYPAAMPSWYNLFFATFGAAALLRYLETRNRRWLFVAGVCGGVSILIKVIGAYYIAAVLLALAFFEQSENTGGNLEEKVSESWPYRIFSASALLLFFALLVEVLHPRLGIAEAYHFLLPSAAVVGLILLGERGVRAKTAERFGAIFRTVVPFLAGVVTPVIVFLIPYARSGAVGRIFTGAASSAITRSVSLGVLGPVGVEKSVFALVVLGVIGAAMYWPEFNGKLVGAVLGLGSVVLLWKAMASSEIILGVWYSAATMTPLIVLSGAVLVLWSQNRDGLTKLQQQRVVVLISLAALCSLVQYPFAASIYLSYSLPLTLLAACAIVSTAKRQSGTYVLVVVTGFYLVFGVLLLVPDYVYELTHKVGRMEVLPLQRAGGLRINHALDFVDLIRFLQQHSPNGLLYAGNDCPELYFLSGLKNVTRDDGGAAPEDVLQALQSDDLKLVVINEAPLFPGGVTSPEVRAAVTRKFPYGAHFGKFTVFWKE